MALAKNGSARRAFLGYVLKSPTNAGLFGWALTFIQDMVYNIQQKGRLTMDEKLLKAIQLLENGAKKLKAWANESENGGWSTHQVDPMRKRAQFLRKEIAKLQS